MPPHRPFSSTTGAAITTTVSKYVLRSLYRSLLRASTPFSPPHSPSASTYASLLHRSGISHDWEECIHQLEKKRRIKAAAANALTSSTSTVLANAKNNPIKGHTTTSGKERNIPRSWARNLSRSYADLLQEYQMRKDYFKQRYEADYDDSLDWEDEDDDENNNDPRSSREEASTHSTRMGNSSYYQHRHHHHLQGDDFDNHVDEYYSSENDPKNVLFRHLLREWCVFTGSGGGGSENNIKDDDHDDDDAKQSMTTTAAATTTTNQWPKKWSPDEEGYYEHGKIKQVTLMKFPSQIQGTGGGGGLSVRDIIRREFRAPSVEERLQRAKEEEEERERSKSESTTDAKDPRRTRTPTYPPSSYIDNNIRIQTAFYTLMELNRKLAWAEAIGFPPLLSPQQRQQTASIQQSRRDEMKWKRWVQAAKGVSLFPTKTITTPTQPTTVAYEPKQTSTANTKNTTPSSCSSSILQCGTYLIAHPLMAGYFAKSVIVILDHAEDEENNNGKPATSEGEEVEGEESSSSGGSGGGTYGLIINRLALQPETMETSNQRQHLEMMLRLRRQTVVGEEGELKTSSRLHDEKKTEVPQSPSCATTTTTTTKHPHNVFRSISLLQAINADDLPEIVQMAFGDAPVREGGPVNLSLQMIHRKSLSEVVMKDEEEDIAESKGKREHDIGGMILLGNDHDRSKKDTEDPIYFGGDVIKAAYAVLGGESDRDDFSFVVGAACWAPGQLQYEIERGCWLPFRGPASMALTGMCEHNEISIPTSSNINNDCENITDVKGTTKLSLFPPRPSHPPTGALLEQTSGGQSLTRRPVGDLWLSVMCALGEGEAELAYMMLDQNNVMHKLGDACDNFDR